jgi:predicted phage baseplate assembly protein
MSLPQIELDDRTFQDLVSEARLRIAQACPEWTEHNVSDPGITLIELFAWMTEMTIYRLNRLPDKLHMTLMELLGIRLDGPSAAQTTLRFALDESRERPVRIPAGTQVSTAPQPGGEPVVFATEAGMTIPVLGSAAFVTVNGGMQSVMALGDQALEPDHEEWEIFGAKAVRGDGLCLGFEEPLAGLTLSVRVDAEPTQAVGVESVDGLVWEVSQADGEWVAAAVLSDTTDGLLTGGGTVELQAPDTSHVVPLAGYRLHWLRCRLAAEDGPWYTHTLRLRSAVATATGAGVVARHAGRYEDETLGVSDGTPGQAFPLRHRPVLRLEAGETLAVRDAETGEESLWEPRPSFEDSTELDRHYCLDPISGTVELGPAIRHRDGSWTAYGGIPPRGAELRFTRYRAGGGKVGNVAANTLTHLVDPLDGVASVTNPAPAVGGVDAETLESARLRASMQIRTRSRAVTAEDFEFLAAEASPRVARAVCIPPFSGEAVALHLLPRAVPADRRLEYDELMPGAELFQEVAEYLDERRLIGTVLELRPCRFRGLSVVVNVQVSPLVAPYRVEQDIAYRLYCFLNPLIGGAHGNGWPFGRPLNTGELYGIINDVDGVDFVKVLRVYETDLATGEQTAKPMDTHVVLERDELVASAQHIVKATHMEA